MFCISDASLLVTSDKPGNHDINESGMGLIGTNSSLATFNLQPVKLGPVEKDKEFLEDVERALTKQVNGNSAFPL